VKCAPNGLDADEMPTESLLGRPGIDTPLLSRREPSTRGLQLRMCIAKRLPLSWLPISRLSTTRMCLSFRQNRTLPPLLSEQVGEAEQAEQAEQQSRASRRERERESKAVRPPVALLPPADETGMRTQKHRRD